MIHFLVDPFRQGYMMRALIEVVIVGVVAGAAGVYVVLRKVAFMGDALTHSVFPGVVLAVTWHVSIVWGALAAGVLTALALARLSRIERVGTDAGLALILSTFFAVGVVVVSRRTSYTADLTLLLVGQVLAVDRGQIVTTAVLAAVALAALAAFHKELVLRAFDVDAAEALGYRPAVLDLVLNVTVAIVVVAALRSVGTVLSVALIVTPAVTARLVTGRVSRMIAVSIGITVLAGWIGLAVSYDASVHHGVRLASGGAIVAVLSATFLLVLAGTQGARAIRRTA